MVRWTVYTREGCKLCDELLIELGQLLDPDAAAQVVVIDIADDPGLESRYGSRVPVLLADGDFVCAYRLDEERVKAHLATGAG